LAALVFGELLLGTLTRFAGGKTHTAMLSSLRRTHRVLGWCLSITALITSYYGLQLYNDTYIGVLYLTFAVIGSTFIVFEIHRLLGRKGKFSRMLPCFRSKRHLYTHQQVYDGSKDGLVVYDDKVIDVSDFGESHPGGLLFIQGTLGEDLGKYINGVSAFDGKYLSYAHSRAAKTLVKQLAVGIVPYQEGIILGRKGRPDLKKMIWKLVGKNQVADNEIYKFSFSSDVYQAAVSCPGVEWMGKHFLVRSRLGLETVRRYYSLVLCLNFASIERWNASASKVGIEILPDSPTIQSSINELISSQPEKDSYQSLVLVIKAYP
jgi:cytochrome b involved in lipid metabolism